MVQFLLIIFFLGFLQFGGGFLKSSRFFCVTCILILSLYVSIDSPNDVYSSASPIQIP